MDISKLTDFELLIIGVMYKRDEEWTVNELIDTIEKVKGVRYIRTTISTYTGILTRKGIITARKQGRHYYYKTVYSREEFMSALNKSYLDFWYGGSVIKFIEVLEEAGQLKK